MSGAAPVHVLVVLPILVPLATAMACALAGPQRGRQAVLGVGGALVGLAAAAALLGWVAEHGMAVTFLGGWSPPYGIALAADRLGALVVLLAALVGATGTAFAVATLEERLQLRQFMLLLHLMLAGIGGFALTADLFNFYVWFELILVSSFGLMVLGGERGEIEGATKYFAINIVGSMLLLSGIGLLYALTGTLSFATLPERLAEAGRPHFRTAVAAMLLVALGIKSAAFPLFFWLPASYHAPPIAVTAVFGGILTKIGVYGLIRLFTLLFTHDTGYTHQLILWIGGATMVAGVVGAVAQRDLRRLLSFHIISQIGYMLVGIGLYTAAGLTAAIFFLVHIIVVKTALFFVSGVVERLRDSFDLERVGGLYAERPAVAALFLVPALSLGGIPPLSGFVAKLSIVQAGLGDGHYGIVATALAVSLLTLYSMAKIWTLAFWSEPAEDAPPPRRRTLPLPLWAPAAALAVLAVGLGLGAGPLLEYAAAAARDLMDPSVYVAAVLGEAPR